MPLSRTPQDRHRMVAASSSWHTRDSLSTSQTAVTRFPTLEGVGEILFKMCILDGEIYKTIELCIMRQISGK